MSLILGPDTSFIIMGSVLAHMARNHLNQSVDILHETETYETTSSCEFLSIVNKGKGAQKDFEQELEIYLVM